MATQRWPVAWLMTDERIGDQLDAAIARAAEAGAGIIVRHHASARKERARIARMVLDSGALLGLSRDSALAEEVGAALVHNPDRPSALPFSLSVHDAQEAALSAQHSAALIFVSPIFPTRSHPHAPSLGPEGALALARLAAHSAIGLGGVNEERGRVLMELGFAGWAGIDCWLKT